MKGLIIKSTGLWYIILSGGETYRARLRGKFRQLGLRTTNPIAVGDEVIFSVADNENVSIEEILDRHNYVIRKSTKLSAQAHMIASNIDLALLIVTLKEPRTSLGFIDRFLITTESFRIPVLIAFNKSDLFDESDKIEIERLKQIYSSLGYECLTTSTVTGENLNLVKEKIKGSTTLITGHSGVGKSSLLNTLSPQLDIKTADISKMHAKGKHTTTFSEMHFLDDTTNIIDTPGIKEIGLFKIKKEELAHFYPEMREHLGKCKFHNCTHYHEPKCHIQELYMKGEINDIRFENYLAILDSEDMNEEEY